jgi:hypothetical protein
LVFGVEYLRELNLEETQRLLSINKKRGFSGMLGSIDCMHWSGRTALLHGRGSIQVTLRVARSYLRLLLAKIYGFDIIFSE